MTDQKIVDAIVAYNRARWEELVAADVLYSRPYLDLDLDRARAFVDAHGIMGDVAGKDVLCLAGGGGQQSAAFGLLGARTTVFDLTAGQLDKDRQVAAHYGLELTIVQGDMRDLSVFADRSFDIVYHAFSISFVPDVRPVFSEVARVLRPDGLYRTHWSNPFVVGIDEREWDGRAYPLNRPYRDGEELIFSDDHWEFERADGTVARVPGPKEYRHTLSRVVNTLAGLGFSILGLWEETTTETDPEPGSWDHFKLIAPPWLEIWTRYLPELNGNPSPRQ